MRSLEINLISWPPIPGFPGISTYVDGTHYLGLSVLPGRSSDIWRELKNLATTESNTSYIGTSNTMRSRETWSWDLMRLGLIESHENSHLTRVILVKILILRKHTRRDWDPTLIIIWHQPVYSIYVLYCTTYYSVPQNFVVFPFFLWIKGWANFELTTPVHKKCVSLRCIQMY